MNDLEKRSFYSFLGLYVISSFLFLSLVGYWYYTAQKNALDNEMYYKLQHASDTKASDIIMAHMQGSTLKSTSVPKEITLALINLKGKVVEGTLMLDEVPQKTGYLKENAYDVFVSDAPREHLGIRYVVAQSSDLSVAVQTLFNTVLGVMLLVAALLVVIAWVLSKLFMKPVRQKVEQIEQFINDVTHELNTPITALTMATNQALKQGHASEKTLKNISISTKQLYDIYSSLTYLNFSESNERAEPIDISVQLQKSITYYTPLCESKRIKILLELEEHIFSIPQVKLQLLFGNLIGNAIKYSPAGSTMTLSLHEGVFSIKDEGIGIALGTEEEIFKKFKRGTEYSGGFGVGLSIVKSICEEYEIGLTLHSIADGGTEFSLQF